MVATEETLSRQISSLDLNTALRAVQNLPNDHDLRYTKDELLGLRPIQEKENVHIKASEIPGIDESVLDGVKTPPYRSGPNPPPPTPATPLASPELVHVSSDDHGRSKDGEDNAALPPPAAEAPAEPPKKKKKSRGSGKNKKPAATGFEEFYCDPPITPDEHEEEEDLYADSRPFPERIQTCIQRYRARRKLDEVKSNVLTKYFLLGGVESTTKAFTGGALDTETLENATAAEIQALQASDMILTEKNKNSKYYDGSNDWVVDFEGVAKGFFSYRVPRMFPIDTKEELSLYCAVIRNFLNYVLQHAVCPEYTQDIMAARKICDQAEKELWKIRQLNFRLPGAFNIAASTLYEGRYQNVYTENAWGNTEDKKQVIDDALIVNRGLSIPEAENIFKTAIAFVGTDELFEKVMKFGVKIIKSENRSFEIIGIDLPNEKTLSDFDVINKQKMIQSGEAGYIKALGSLKVKAWEGPGFEPEDFTDDEDNGKSLSDEIESFWLEEDILKLFTIGMKMECKVHELNVGVKFFDTLYGVYCSFHCMLPNEKMMGWKEPAPNTRPAPNEDDPDIEERAIEAAMQEEFEKTEKDFAV